MFISCNATFSFGNASGWALKELEAVELPYARKNRDQIAWRIKKKIEPVVQALELSAIQFEFLEFCEPASVSGRTRNGIANSP